MESLIKIVLLAILSLHPKLDSTLVENWAKTVATVAIKYEIRSTLIVATIERASQWRPNLVNCNGSWIKAKKTLTTDKALDLDKIIIEKIKCTASMDFGFGQLNYAHLTDVKMREIMVPENNIELLGKLMATKKKRCPFIPACKKRHWLALLNFYSKPPVETIILAIERKILKNIKTASDAL